MEGGRGGSGGRSVAISPSPSADTESDTAAAAAANIALTREVEQLQSALAQVAALAKQAHRATLEERQTQAETVQELQSQLDSFAGGAKPGADESTSLS